MSEKIGDRFQKETKYSRFSLGGGGLDWSTKPEIYKTYPNSKKTKLEITVSTEESADKSAAFSSAFDA